MTLDTLGMRGDAREPLRGGFHQAYGAVLVTGPTGSGKSTTLYAALNAINSIEKNIITIEDPVEYQLSGHQPDPGEPQGGPDVSRAACARCCAPTPTSSWSARSATPRRRKIAIESALTGHLVLSTLHTNDAPSAITRLTEMGIEPFLTASAVDCVVAQRLVRTLCTLLQAAHAAQRRCAGGRGLPGRVRHRGLRAGRLRALRRLRLQGPQRPLRGDDGLGRDPRADDRARLRRRDHARWRSSRACACCATTASRRSRPASRRSPRSRGSRRSSLRFPTELPIGTRMDFDFADVLLEVMSRRGLGPAPDGGLAADGARARPAAPARLPAADPAGRARDRLLDPHQRPAPEARERLADRPRLLDPGQGPLPRQRLLPARLDRRRLPPDPAGDAGARRRSGCRRSSRTSRKKPRGFVLVTGPDRLRQVDDARGDDRPDQRAAPRAHHDHRGPDRVPPPSQELHRQPARARARTPRASRWRSRPRCARTRT